MKVAVTIIAHNEEKNIDSCLVSVFDQTRKADEIIVICHNCTDRTESIARQFDGVSVIRYDGPEGDVWARMKAMESTSDDVDIIISTDGDSFVSKVWIERLAGVLENDPEISLAGGPVFFFNSFFANLMSLSFFYTSPYLRGDYKFYPWGANNAFRRKDYFSVGGHKELVDLKDKLKLNFWAEDLYLALLLDKVGKLKFIKQACVWTKSPPIGVSGWISRSRAQNSDKKKLFAYFGLFQDKNSSLGADMTNKK